MLCYSVFVAQGKGTKDSAIYTVEHYSAATVLTAKANDNVHLATILCSTAHTLVS